MKRSFRGRRSARIGVALGGDCLSAALVRRTRQGWTVERTWERALVPLDGTVVEWPELFSALAELREEWQPDPAGLWIALLPPLVQVRRIELPPLREREARAVLARDASRYFPAVTEPQVLGVASIGDGRAAPSPILAAAAPLRLVEAILGAAARAEWQIASLAPAHWAWLAVAKEGTPHLCDSTAIVVADLPTCTEVLCVEEGELVRVRRLPVGERSQAVMRELSARAAHVQAMTSAENSALAATFAPRVRAPQILPDHVHHARRKNARGVAYRRATAAAALLVAAAGVELWGTNRELAAVHERRQALRAQVERAMAEREAILSVNDRLVTLADLERTAPAWSARIASLAELVPRDAHLTALRGRADSLVVQGVAERAVGVFEAVQKAPGVAGVRAEAPIRQELRDGRTPVERFVLAASWSSTGAGKASSAGSEPAEARK